MNIGFVYGQQQVKIGSQNTVIEDWQQRPMRQYYVTAKKVLWQSDDNLIQNSEILLNEGNSQAYFGQQNLCTIKNEDGNISGLILDFGKEIHGGIQITTSKSNNSTPKVRIRFGESVSETFSESMNVPSGPNGVTNHHSIRDFTINLPGYGTMDIGSTGFRFVRIDLLDSNAEIRLKEVRALATIRDLEYKGSFKSNDTLLNKIWETGAYTVQLCMQDYLIDGIKRDRMVWAGDMHPEMMTINTVFGYNEVFPKSLDFLKETTPLPQFMNGIPTYSMWWVLMQHDWYLYQGDLEYLQQQKTYLIDLLDLLNTYVDNKGKEQLHDVGMRFIDWPSYRDEKAVHAGIQAMMVMTFEKGAQLCSILGEEEKGKQYRSLVKKMKKYKPDHNASKEAAALLSLSGIGDSKALNDQVIAVNGAEDFSAFFGYYMLLAQAEAEDYKGAIDNIRSFWGAMLDLGATTFWEEFDLAEAKNAKPIDEVLTENDFNYHCQTGDHCYKGLRRSLCHGWSSGPTPWLTEIVLGVKVLEPGCTKIKIEPHLGDLDWVEGKFPTPYGSVFIHHVKMPDGSVQSKIEAPEQVQIVEVLK